MSVVKSLYELQGMDEVIAGGERRLARILAELKGDEAVVDVRRRLDDQLEEQAGLQKAQHALEWEIDDLTGKIDKAQEELYSGRIRNPKELANLEQEVAVLKVARSGKEDEVITLIEQVEAVSSQIEIQQATLAGLETEWRTRQAELNAEKAVLEAKIADLRAQREALLAQINPEITRFYTDLRAQKTTAVARVDQGICQGCRLALSNAELQRARGDALTQCSSCGRILFLM